MDLPFTGFELTFIIIAFTIFSFFSLASVYTHRKRPTISLTMDIELAHQITINTCIPTHRPWTTP
uniref:Uncharacterized protein n=1 Tax=Echeneis naucrates TaxID=173247 RepID=A0A665TCS9_ECHNA